MKHFIDDNKRMGALMTVVVLAVGSISVVGTTHFAMASQIGKLCVFFACGNATITGGTSGSGSGGGGQPTPTTGTLTVIKKVICSVPEICGRVTPNLFTITVTGNNPSPPKVNDDGTGTQVTLGPGQYTVSEEGIQPFGFLASFSGNCDSTGKGTIAAGETQTCTVTNTFNAA